MVSTWKERIPEWDEPSGDVDELAARYKKRQLSCEGVDLPYRLFVPEVKDDSAGIPLVVFLHGADVTGTDNEMQLRAHDIGIVYARKKMQEEFHPAILVPQYNRHSWSRAGMMLALDKMIRDTCDEYPIIDADRLYVYGYSAGGIGALRIMKSRPGMFKKAIIMCASTDEENLEALTGTPMWLFHAVDDAIVPCYGFGSHLGSGAIYERLHPIMGDDIRYTEYATDEIMRDYHVHPHCAWVPVAMHEEALTWLLT